MKNVLIGVLSSERRRNDSSNVHFHQMSEEDRYRTAKDMMKSLFNNGRGSSKKQVAFNTMIDVGVVVIETKRAYEKSTDEFHKSAKDLMKSIATDTGYVIPDLVTAPTVLKMSMKCNLLEEENINELF